MEVFNKTVLCWLLCQKFCCGRCNRTLSMQGRTAGLGDAPDPLQSHEGLRDETDAPADVSGDFCGICVWEELKKSLLLPTQPRLPLRGCSRICRKATLPPVVDVLYALLRASSF